MLLAFMNLTKSSLSNDCLVVCKKCTSFWQICFWCCFLCTCWPQWVRSARMEAACTGVVGGSALWEALSKFERKIVPSRRASLCSRRFSCLSRMEMRLKAFCKLVFMQRDVQRWAVSVRSLTEWVAWWRTKRIRFGRLLGSSSENTTLSCFLKLYKKTKQESLNVEWNNK